MPTLRASDTKLTEDRFQQPWVLQYAVTSKPIAMSLPTVSIESG